MTLEELKFQVHFFPLLICAWTDPHTQTDKHKHTQTHTDTETYTQTQTHTDPHTYTDIHRHTQTHTNTQTQRHRDTEAQRYRLFLFVSLSPLSCRSLSLSFAVLSLSRFLFPFLCLPDTHTLSFNSGVASTNRGLQWRTRQERREYLHDNNVCFDRREPSLCGRSLLNAGVWQCTRFSQFFFWWSLTNDPKWSTRSHSTATLQYFGDSPRRGVPGTPYSWNKLKSQRIKSIRHLSGIERVPYVIATCT